MNHPRNHTLTKADLLFQEAFAAHNAGDLVKAEELYRKALSKAPADMETLYLLGTLCSQQGKFVEAEKHLKAALRIAPDHPEALNNLGLTLKGLHKAEEAVTVFRQALKVRPDYADAHANLAYALEMLGELDEAETHAREALKLNPALANAHYTLGLILNGRNCFEEAAQCFLNGLAFNPDFSAAYNDLGGIYRTWGRMEQALACFDRAIALNPNAYNSHNNRGAVYEELGRFDEALAEYETATRLRPEDEVAKWNTAYLFLRQGILDRGWEAHELRLKTGAQVQDRFPYLSWDGASLSDKTILVYAEQGLGDEIFYASCIPDVIAQAKHCVIECDERMAPLYARSFPQATVQGAKRLEIDWILTVPKIDVQSAVGSLPRYLRPTLDSFPDRAAYLFADPQRVEYWRSRLSALGPELKVGICWRSGIAKGERHKHYSELAEWGNIFRVSGVRFIKLQYDECEEELAEAEALFGVKIERFPEVDMKNELDETCALITAFDVVITAGTAVSEMAGALGVETYRLDAYGKPMEALGTGRSPWHPRMKLFGQQSLGDWSIPLALAAEELAMRVNGAQEIEYVTLESAQEVAVKATQDDLSSYILRERKRWFDAEYGFVLAYAQNGMRVVDAGAGVGAYAIPMAARLGSGKLWAMTQTPAETELLMKSRQHNRLETRMGITIVDSNRSLDAEMDLHGLDDIAFMRVAADLCRPEFFSGGARFFEKNSPLVMLGTRSGEDAAFVASEWLMARGYRLYYLVPGLQLLVPLLAAGDIDIFTTNLFACKPDRAQALEQDGLLISQPVSLNNLPGAEAGYWQTYLGSMAFAAGRVAEWVNAQPKEKDWEIYWMALNLYAISRSERPAPERYASLQMANSVLNTLMQSAANLPRLLTWCRVLTDLGKREAAVSLLNRLCQLLNAGMTPHLAEPCIALNEKFANIDPANRESHWIFAMVLAHREDLRAFSDFFTGREALTVLQEIKAAGFGDEDIDRRIALIKQRFATA